MGVAGGFLAADPPPPVLEEGMDRGELILGEREVRVASLGPAVAECQTIRSDLNLGRASAGVSSTAPLEPHRAPTRARKDQRDLRAGYFVSGR